MAIYDISEGKCVNTNNYTRTISIDRETITKYQDNMALVHLYQRRASDIVGVDLYPRNAFNQKDEIFLSYSRSEDFPLFLSYIKDNLSKWGRKENDIDNAIVYMISGETEIGYMSLQNLMNIMDKNSG